MSKMFEAEKLDFARVSNDSAGSGTSHFVGVEESFAIGSFYAEDELGLAMSQHQLYQQQQPPFEEFGDLDDLYLDVFPPFQLCEDELRKIFGTEANSTKLTELEKSQSFSLPSASFDVLRQYRSRSRKLDGELSNAGYKMQSTHGRGPSLLTETTIRLAAEEFIQSMLQNSNELSLLNHPYPSPILAHSGEDSNKGIQLVLNLLYCAEKIAENQYACAINFLKECEGSSSCIGTPIQRLVFYFCEALFEKIAMETGRYVANELEEKPVDPIEMVMIPSITLCFAFHKDYAPTQIPKLGGMQAILDNLGEATKVHMIDLDIRSGVQWIILMQALAARTNHPPIQNLKITAVSSTCKSILEETGKHLASFSQSLNLNLKFTFKVVLVEDILELNENLFDLDADESVFVYTSYFLTTMVGSVDRLNHLMTVMRNMHPRVMVVTELEVNCNSPSFIGRFIGSLFFFGACFDSVSDCFENDQTTRTNAESTVFRCLIKNILAGDDELRRSRHVNINTRRAFFEGLGLVEIELSTSSLDQATLGLHSFSRGSSCTLYRDGKCLTVGWKGTPLHSVSAWKFE